MNNQTDPAIDADGYLLDWQQWSSALAQRWASADGLELTPAHWELLQLARDYYSRYHVAPGMRILVMLLRNADQQADAQPGQRGEGQTQQVQGAPKRVVDSRYLYRLFNVGAESESPGRQACRYAGLPKPVSCI